MHIIVIGSGVYGLGAAHWLSTLDPSQTVTVLEREKVGHPQNSSYGDSRIFRRMHSSRYYADMATAALRLWHELEHSTGQALLSRQGLLFFGRAETGETIEGSLPGALATMRELGLEHEHCTATEINSRWPMRAGEGEEGVFEAGAGVLHAGAICACLRSAAQARGVRVCEGEGAERLSMMPDGKVSVLTSKGRSLLADRLIVAAGPWTNDVLAHLGHSLDLEIWRCLWGHASCAPELAERLPLWYYFGEERPAKSDGGLYYGFPAGPGPAHLMKVGCDFAPQSGEHRVRRMADFRWEADARMAQLLDSFMQSRWPGRCQLVDLATSPYTITQDQHFILDRLPGLEQVIIFAGDCGRGFKFSILLSKILAELALDQQPCFNIEPLKITRTAAGLQGTRVNSKL